MLTPIDILGETGFISKRLEHYELRKEQLTMAEAVNRAFIEKRHLIVEAGTGVGKSFAYLVPAILQTAGNQNDETADETANDKSLPINVTINNSPSEIIVTNNESSAEGESDWDMPFEYDLPEVYDDSDSPEQPDANHPAELPRVVISTHTISLQEQIMEKDIPFLRSVLPFEFTAVLVKGRSNYLCLRRFYSASQKLSMLFGDFQQRQFERIRDWVACTEDGSKSSLIPEPDWDIWAEICCETGNCMGKRCKSNQKCFYNKARRRIANAQILIVNHALFFSDIALRMHGGGILPVYNMVVFDEAHMIAQVASDHIGISVTQYQVEYNLYRLYNEHAHKGLLVESNINAGVDADFIDGFQSGKKNGGVGDEMIGEAREAVMDCLNRTAVFFGDLGDWFMEQPGGNGRVRNAGIVRNLLSEGLAKLAERLRRVIEKLEISGLRQELRAVRDKIVTIRDEINSWINQSLQDESVYWIEVKMTIHGKRRVSINAVPIDVGPILRKHLFEQIPSVIMTSATLTIGQGQTRNSNSRIRNHF
ncbi:MAG: DEAD/DEAH box helicase [Planctomycetaceae bacterium]|nr:DEAD/DEAH box helicase [Planctomycetaceae bacterium]